MLQRWVGRAAATNYGGIKDLFYSGPATLFESLRRHTPFDLRIAVVDRGDGTMQSNHRPRPNAGAYLAKQRAGGSFSPVSKPNNRGALDKSSSSSKSISVAPRNLVDEHDPGSRQVHWGVAGLAGKVDSELLHKDRYIEFGGSRSSKPK